MSEPPDAAAAEKARVGREPVDTAKLEARLLALERRLDEYEARDRCLVEVIEAVSGLTDVIGPLIKVVRSVLESQRPPPADQTWPLPAQHSGFAAAPASQQVASERSERARNRLRETLFVDTQAAASEGAQTGVLVAETQPDAVAGYPPPGRKSWLLRAFKRMVKEDPPGAGRLLRALLPAHGLAQLPPVADVPWPPAISARLLAAGRIRRRLGWERAGPECDPNALSRLAPLVRLRASPAHLYASGVRLDADLAFALVGLSIEPAWTAGHCFTIAHREAEGVPSTAYLAMRGGVRPMVATEPPPASVTTTICCAGPTLLTVLAGQPPGDATVIGERTPLQLVQEWFARAIRR